MKINKSNLNVVNPRVTRTDIASTKPSKTDRQDSFALNTQDRALFEKINQIAKASPGIDIDKVQAVKKQIEAGTYNVPPEQLAGSILDRFDSLDEFINQPLIQVSDSRSD